MQGRWRADLGSLQICPRVTCLTTLAIRRRTQGGGYSTHACCCRRINIASRRAGGTRSGTGTSLAASGHLDELPPPHASISSILLARGSCACFSKSIFPGAIFLVYTTRAGLPHIFTRWRPAHLANGYLPLRLLRPLHSPPLFNALMNSILLPWPRTEPTCSQGSRHP